MNRPTTDDLPVMQCVPEILAALQAGKSVVLKAPPGAGKTTGIPPVLLNHAIAGEGKILLIQPRRLAARSAAARLASLVGTKLGDDVGYHVRFDKKVSHQTRLIAMTTGMLLRRLHDDPLLEDVGCVLLDEFHERSLEVDLALGMLQRIRTTLRPELRLMVMSATLDPQPIADFLGDAVSVVSEGRTYPVDVRYSQPPAKARVSDQVAGVLPDALKSSRGHLLVFLPGVGEIRSTARLIGQRRLDRDATVMELYGDLSPADQDAVLRDRPDGGAVERKIILATNVAETSITIPGVTTVVDSGLARVMRFDRQVGLPKLMLEPISQASADQRSGRAGRTQPGVCIRLWPAAANVARRAADTPEISRGDLSGAMLTLAAWGERDVLAFPWITPPPIESVELARRYLQRVGAVDDDGKVTSMGNQMAALPLHPRLSRFMIEAAELSEVDDAAIAAALLTERDPFRGSSTAGMPSSGGSLVTACDVTDRVERMKQFRDGDASAVANVAAAKQVLRVADQIRRVTPVRSGAKHGGAPETRLQRSLLAAYPDRVARRRKAGDPSGVMVGGRGVKLDRGSSCRSGELFLCIDVDANGTEATVRAASTIDESWLDDELIREIDEPFYYPSMKSVVARRRRYFDDLLLAESPIPCQPNAETAQILMRHALADLESVFPRKDKAVGAFIDRVRFLTAQMPELELPALDDEGVQEVLQQLCQTRTSIAQLQSAPWLDHLKGRYDWSQLQLIDQHAPTKLKVPSGNSMVIHYAADRSPWMEVRIQELFGCAETPRIAGGRVLLQLHLLGPNYRPQQITEDLQNFWRETYQHVRKELRRRYPKHHWPEDPTTATATTRGLKPK
ncbi:ATP-dependent RNA helicase HrpB [Rubripirellula lacrimiformis]|uniref:ATP-dependent RNA helicase HrpB n=1 Tax=Rubripirellula lacrimiformis TaxID=1930273 RepID=A0A517NI66_9BACT|nr:ATP-dependent helicase HrpB [Rubripirellula lacrimiformis]QDT06826.1 ATP-dependent RNA helicase HrpB [Rubripirellula lacrimiformis]